MTKDMQPTAASLILWLRDNMPFGKGCAGEPDIDRVTDDSKVTDHHAIIPTVEIARTDLSELPSGGAGCAYPACRQTALCHNAGKPV
mgnify:CR=1 FL=1